MGDQKPKRRWTPYILPFSTTPSNLGFVAKPTPRAKGILTPCYPAKTCNPRSLSVGPRSPDSLPSPAETPPISAPRSRKTFDTSIRATLALN